MTIPRYDIAIVGGGIVGLATAYALSQRERPPRIVLFEKEGHFAAHQTGRNSGVIHSGIYYKPGSLKARTCRAGKARLESFCREHDVAFERCGKVIVAVDDAQLPALQALEGRGQENGVECRAIDTAELAELEPHAKGVAALHVPETGIVDYIGVCGKLAELAGKRGVEWRLGTRVLGSHQAAGRTVVKTTGGECEVKLIVNCAGLHSDRVGRRTGGQPTVRIVPFRGEYYELVPARRSLCRNLIYPVPEPGLPFLGVHFTRGVDGSVECGPNAVLAFAREGYERWKIVPFDLLGTLGYPGFWRLAMRHARVGVGEWHRSINKGAYTRALQRLVPEVTAADLVPRAAGVRAQAVDSSGSLVDDFDLQDAPGALHVYNAPSPAATASLEIGAVLAERASARVV